MQFPSGLQLLKLQKFSISFLFSSLSPFCAVLFPSSVPLCTRLQPLPRVAFAEPGMARSCKYAIVCTSLKSSSDVQHALGTALSSAWTQREQGKSQRHRLLQHVEVAQDVLAIFGMLVLLKVHIALACLGWLGWLSSLFRHITNTLAPSLMHLLLMLRKQQELRSIGRQCFLRACLASSCLTGLSICMLSCN